MYLYSFDRFFGFDKICILGENEAKKKVKVGDLLIFGNQYFLALGETLAFAEQYQQVTSVKAELVYKSFLSLPAVKLIHRMVETHYTTYKSVMRLFFTMDIQKLLERENKLKRWKIERFNPGVPKVGDGKVEKFNCSVNWQTLIVFPDLRTMYNSSAIADSNWELRIKDWELSSSVTLLSSNTQNQKDVHRWEIKKWVKSVIICTYAEIFQDFCDLKKIIFVDPHKWYYASQQDPRYKVGEVIEEMKKLWGAEVEIVGV